MLPRSQLTSEIEKATRALWLGHASHQHFGQCDTCGRTYDEDGRPLFVARQERKRKFECLDCWDEGQH